MSLETRAGRDLPGVDPGELPLLWITDLAVPAEALAPLGSLP